MEKCLKALCTIKVVQVRVNDKKTANMFRMEVLKCLSRDYLAKERVIINLRRVREYMVAYFILSLKEILKETSNSTQATGSNKSAANISLKELQPHTVSA